MVLWVAMIKGNLDLFFLLLYYCFLQGFMEWAWIILLLGLTTKKFFKILNLLDLELKKFFLQGGTLCSVKGEVNRQGMGIKII